MIIEMCICNIPAAQKESIIITSGVVVTISNRIKISMSGNVAIAAEKKVVSETIKVKGWSVFKMLRGGERKV